MSGRYLTPNLYVYEPENPKAYTVYYFWCQPCKRCHPFDTPRWKFDGNIEKPTFAPSLLLTSPPTDYRCHLVLRCGKIEYCGDCNHEMKGQVVDMVPIPEGYGLPE